MSPTDALQVVDSEGAFDERAANRAAEAAGLPRASDGRYGVVAVMGPQSSGKSTLLNAMFGTTFEEMDALGGRKQTTRGIWLAPAASSSGRGASSLSFSLSPPLALPLLVLDLEGNDGRERGEDDAAFERRAALFALAVSDAVVVNMWAKDVGREAGAGKPLLKTILSVNLKLFANGVNSGSATTATTKNKNKKTTLLFVFRDRTKTPLQLLSQTWQSDLESMWDSLTKPPALRDSKLNDFFDVRYAALSNFEEREEAFGAEAAHLASLFGVSSSSNVSSSSSSPWNPASDFVDSESPMLGQLMTTSNGGNGNDKNVLGGRLPGDAWVLSAKSAWEAISSSKDLDLPAHRVMVASIRCSELAMEALESMGESEGFRAMMRDAAEAGGGKNDATADGDALSSSSARRRPIPDFAPRASAILSACLKSYDAEACYYEESTREVRRVELLFEAAKVLGPAHEAHISALASQALASFRSALLLKASGSSSDSFVERAAAAKSAALEEFEREAAKADDAVVVVVENSSSPPPSLWSSKAQAAALAAACDAHAKQERASAVSEAEAKSCASLRDALAKPAAALFDAAPPPSHLLWKRARSLLSRAADAAADRAEASVSASYGLDGDEVAALRSRIKGFGSRVVASKAKEAAASALPRAKQRFSDSFSRDESGLPRHWASVGGIGSGSGGDPLTSSSKKKDVADEIRAAAVAARRAAASLLASLAVLRLDEDDWGGDDDVDAPGRDGGVEAKDAVADEIERAVLSYAAGDDGAALASAAAKKAPSSSSSTFDLDAASSWPAPATEEGTLLSPAELRAHWRAVAADSAVSVAAALAAADAAAQAQAAARRANGPPLWSIVAMAILGANEAAGLLRSPLKLLLVVSVLLFVRTVYKELDVDGELARRGLLPAAIAIAAKLWPTTVRVAARTADALLGALLNASGGGGRGDGGMVLEREQQQQPREYDDDATFARNNSIGGGSSSGAVRQRRQGGGGAVEMTGMAFNNAS